MFTIAKTFTFEASHQLDGLPDGHQCGRLHGHSYQVQVTLQGWLDEVGFVIDYGELTPIRDLIDGELDHQHLNDVLADDHAHIASGRPHDANPTAERLAWWLYQRITALGLDAELVAVRVHETAKTWAEYAPAKRTTAAPALALAA